MSNSNIEWTDVTWNPTTGCTKISAGCKICYAGEMHTRLTAMGQEKYSEPFNVVRTHQSELARPYTWNKPRRVFVNSMSDLFHENIPLAFIKQVFEVMNDTHKHTYQILTKRAERLLELSDKLTWSDNIWMGVSIEDNRVLDRMEYLKKTPAKIKFLSCEPLIGPLSNMNLNEVDWVIVGGESGFKNPRQMKKEWVIDIQKQCRKFGSVFFFKQWGGLPTAGKGGRLLDGREYNNFPKVKAVKEGTK